MHPTDDFAHRSGLVIARAVGEGAAKSTPKPVAEVRPTDAECREYALAHALDGFTIMPDTDGDLWEDDGA